MQFLVFCSTVTSYVIFVLSCTILQFRSVYSVFLFSFCTEKNTLCPPQRRWKWWHSLLPATRRILRANGGAPYSSPLLSVPLSHPLTAPSAPSNLSLKDILSHTSQRPKSLVSLRKILAMISLVLLKTPKICYQSIICYRLPLCTSPHRPFTVLVLTILSS